MRIVFNALALPEKKTGGGVYMLNLLKKLKSICESEGSEIIVLLNSENAFHFSELVSNSLSLYDCGSLCRYRSFRILWEQLFLPVLCRKLKADILHSPGFVAPLMLKGVKSVVTLFDTSWFSHVETHQGFKSFYFRLMIPPTIKRANAIIAISESTKRDIQKLFNVQSEKVAITLLATNGKVYNDKPADDALFTSLKKKYRINDPFLLYVGTVEARKNLQRLLDAFLILKEKKKAEQLVFVGKKGWLVEELYHRIQKEKLTDAVCFTGYLPDDEVAELMKRCSCFLYPSLYEGFGIPVLEALSCGALVVTSDCSSLPEVAGNAGFLCNPLDTKDIAEKTEFALNLTGDELKERRALAFSQAGLFSWEKTAEETYRLYEEVLKG